MECCVGRTRPESKACRGKFGLRTACAEASAGRAGSGAPRRFGCELYWVDSRAERVRRNRRLIQSAVALALCPPSVAVRLRRTGQRAPNASRRIKPESKESRASGARLVSSRSGQASQDVVERSHAKFACRRAAEWDTPRSVGNTRAPHLAGALARGTGESSAGE